MEFPLQPIGIIHSCYKEKFGIPRQARLAPEASGSLELLPPYDREEALQGLEGFSHVWLVFIFHEAQRGEWSPTVRPPRLGGNERRGVFSTRSPFRPNSIGLSAVTLDGFERKGGKLFLYLKGIDVLDGTPVLDIKPYLPYADAIPDATAGFATKPPMESLSVKFTPEAQERCTALEGEGYRNLSALIEQTLQYDPRPAYRRDEADGAEYGMKLLEFDVKWRMKAKEVTVFRISSKTS